VRIVVAGGAGFIGSHMCDALIGRGDEVVAVDNLVTGQPSNIAQLEGHEGFTFFEHDITGPFDVGGDVDGVMDLASPASPDDFLRLPLEILAVGSTGTRNLLELAREKQARFFLASTSEVYGDPLVHPQHESYWGNVNPIGPRSCYDEAKRFSEALTVAYQRVHGVDIRIARIFNTYGPRMRPDDGRVVTNFIVQALSGRPVTLYGSGDQTRSFCYIDDEVRGLIALLDTDIAEPVNIGNADEFTMRDLAALVIELTGSNSPIVTVALPAEREGDPAQRRPDITLATNVLGWKPDIGLRDGLARTIAWLREALSAETL
jgi:nucleoside-diphosphate-sugar epimerase